MMQEFEEALQQNALLKVGPSGPKVWADIQTWPNPYPTLKPYVKQYIIIILSNP